MFLDQIRFRVIRDDCDAPEVCPLCTTEEPFFAYSASQPGEQDYEGFCCLRCGQQLLATLQEIELAHWLAAPGANALQRRDSLPRYWSPETWKFAFLLLKAKPRFTQ